MSATFHMPNENTWIYRANGAPGQTAVTVWTSWEKPSWARMLHFSLYGGGGGGGGGANSGAQAGGGGGGCSGGITHCTIPAAMLPDVIFLSPGMGGNAGAAAGAGGAGSVSGVSLIGGTGGSAGGWSAFEASGGGGGGAGGIVGGTAGTAVGHNARFMSSVGVYLFLNGLSGGAGAFNAKGGSVTINNSLPITGGAGGGGNFSGTAFDGGDVLSRFYSNGTDIWLPGVSGAVQGTGAHASDGFTNWGGSPHFYAHGGSGGGGMATGTAGDGGDGGAACGGGGGGGSGSGTGGKGGRGGDGFILVTAW